MTEANAPIRLTGKLTASEVAVLECRHKGRFESSSSPATVNLADVESGDSSALALLLEWQAQAQRAGTSIRFEQPPESLRVIARLTGVAPLLGWSQANEK